MASAHFITRVAKVKQTPFPCKVMIIFESSHAKLYLIRFKKTIKAAVTKALISLRVHAG